MYKCKVCGGYSDTGHADDCPWTLLHEMELERDSAVEALRDAGHRLAYVRKWAALQEGIARVPITEVRDMVQTMASAAWKAGRA